MSALRNGVLVGLICALANFRATAANDLEISTFQLTDSDIEFLAAPEKILQALAKQTGEAYPDTTQLVEAIRGELPNKPEIVRSVNAIVRTELELRSVPGDSSGCGPEFGTKCPVKKIWLDSAAMKVLQAKLVSRRKLTPLSPALLDLIAEIKGIDYPEEELMHQAILARIKAGIGVCMANLSPSQTYVRSLRLSDTAFDAVMDQLIPFSASLQGREIGGNSTVALLTTFRNRTDPCSMSDKDQIHLLLQGIYDSTIRQSVAGLGRKLRSATPSAPRWSEGTCGCVRSNLNGMVFGIYPWWDADTTAQTLDFSVVSRIEFYGLSFDDAGALTRIEPSRHATEFLSQARAHDNKVDWVVARSEWDDWAALPLSRRRATFDTLSGQILELLTRKLPDLRSRLKSRVPYPTQERFTWGDGVTLHFSNYPKDDASVALFLGFVRRMDTLFSRSDPSLHLNLMLSRTSLSRSEGIYAYDKLVEILRLRGVESANAHEERTHLLVFLDEPSSDTKKNLLRDLDFQLHGSDRKLFVRALAPISIYDGKNWKQLADDFTYDNDTYYGMGVWPTPFTGESGVGNPDGPAQRIVQTILDHYQREEGLVLHRQWLDDLTCRHRWRIRALLLVCLLFSIGTAIAAALHCPLRHFLTQHLAYAVVALVLPPLAVFTLLLYFDPDLDTLAQGNTPFVVLASLVVLIFVGLAIFLRSRGSKPSRNALREELRKMGGGG